MARVLVGVEAVIRLPLIYWLVLNCRVGDPAMYPVQLRLDAINLAIRMCEITEWLERRGIKPDVLQYRMAANHVELRVDFAAPEEAAALTEAFAGSVLGITPARQ